MKKLSLFFRKLRGQCIYIDTKHKFTYCTYTDTIRLMPQNYMIAFHSYGHWIADPDSAISTKFATKVFNVLRKHELKFGHHDIVLKNLNSLLKS